MTSAVPKTSAVIAGLLLAAAAVLWLAGCSGQQSLTEPESPALQDGDTLAPPDPAASADAAASALTGGSVANGIETATFAQG